MKIAITSLEAQIIKKEQNASKLTEVAVSLLPSQLIHLNKMFQQDFKPDFPKENSVIEMLKMTMNGCQKVTPCCMDISFRNRKLMLLCRSMFILLGF